MIDWRSVLTLAGAVGCGLIAGVFFAFSTFVMKALSRVPPAQGIAAMQLINVVVINPWFMTAFLGTGVVSVALAVASILTWGQPAAVFELSGSLSYLLGTFLVTIVFNVPRNNALAAADPASDAGARLWTAYLASWTAWNHVRTAAALVAMVLLILALRS
jgi:uncharacterized membrane protein